MGGRIKWRSSIIKLWHRIQWTTRTANKNEKVRCEHVFRVGIQKSILDLLDGRLVEWEVLFKEHCAQII